MGDFCLCSAFKNFRAAALSVLCLCATAAATQAGTPATLSDDNEVVTVAKVPDALRLADFSNHLGLVPPGTKVLAFETKRDPRIPVSWVRVEILEGEYQGKEGWVLTPTVHRSAKAERKSGEPSNSRIARTETVTGSGADSPNVSEPPPQTTHYVVQESWVFSAANFYAVGHRRVQPGDFLEKLDNVDSVDDGVVSFRWLRVRVLTGKATGDLVWLPSHVTRPVNKRLLFAIWYEKGVERAFERAARTQLDEIKARLLREYSNPPSDGSLTVPPLLIDMSIGIRTKPDFLQAWEAIDKRAKEENAQVYYGCLLTESSLQDDQRDGLEFAAPEGIDSTLRPGEILELSKLPWADDAHGLYLNGCFSGAYRKLVAVERDWCPASLFCKKQRVTTWGQPGTSTFSSNPNKHITIKPTDTKIYLFSFNRRFNNPVGDGRRLPHVEFHPESFKPVNE